MSILKHSNLLIEYKELVENGMRFKKPQKIKTIFSIGGRGHYENPISDIIAFFIDPREEHQFETLLLSTIFTLLNHKHMNLDQGTVELVEREAVTPAGNRIDLVVVGGEWVLVIENKIYHDLLNPLKDYENYITSKYPDKTPYYAILSINQVNGIPSPWENILYQDFIIEIKNQAGPYMFHSQSAKWSFFLQDFLLNIEEMIGDVKVDREMIEFVQKNYNKILNLIEVKDNYIETIKKEFTKIIHEVSTTNVTEKVHNWSRRVAIRFYCQELWGKQTNLVLVLFPEGDYKIYYYVYGIEEGKQEIENRKLQATGYKQWKEGKGSILCYKTEQRYDIESARKEFKRMVQHLNGYFNV